MTHDVIEQLNALPWPVAVFTLPRLIREMTVWSQHDRLIEVDRSRARFRG